MQSLFYGLLSFLLLLCITILFILFSTDESKEVYNNMKDNLGKTYILNSNTIHADTLTIVNFSFLNDSYTLSNGLEIHSSLIK